MLEFKKFNKIPRLFRDIIVTEKIDGTNAQVYVSYLEEEALLNFKFIQHVDGEGCAPLNKDELLALWDQKHIPYMLVGNNYAVIAGSRNRWISPTKDNYGFAQWVSDNREDLVKLGPGAHYGEWWGQGIQRKYNMPHKVFSLFNVHRWDNEENRPACCDVVPVLYEGSFSTTKIDAILKDLATTGSHASALHDVEFEKPEGVVVYHKAGNLLFKATIEKDEEPKGLTK